MEQYGKRLKTSKNTKRVSQKKKKKEKVNVVVGQCSLPETTFAYDGYRSLHVSSLKFSSCGFLVTHLTRSATRRWPPFDPKN